MKPEKQISEYYYFDSVWKFVCEKYGFTDDDVFVDNDNETWYGFWQYLCERHEVHNGCYIHLSDWEEKYDNGKFAYLTPVYVRDVTNKILDEFGELDGECLTPNIRRVALWASW